LKGKSDDAAIKAMQKRWDAYTKKQDAADRAYLARQKKAANAVSSARGQAEKTRRHVASMTAQVKKNPTAANKRTLRKYLAKYNHELAKYERLYRKRYPEPG